MSFSGSSRLRICQALSAGSTRYLVDEIRHAFTSQEARRGRDLEVQMRPAGVSGIADARQHLAAPHALSGLHAQAARLQMQIVCELPATQVECDGVTGNRLGRRSSLPRRSRTTYTRILNGA